MKWESYRGTWKGRCPICDSEAFFSPTWQGDLSDMTTLDVVECPGDHPFVIATYRGSAKNNVLFVLPVSGDPDVPNWLPVEYNQPFSEMMFNFKSQKYRSAVALAGIILDAHINSLLRNPGDKKKTLAARLEILSNQKVIDPDQFADGTVARLSRNSVIHPEDIAIQVQMSEAEEVIDAVSSCLERYYKWKRVKALPAPPEQIGEVAESLVD